MHLPGHTTWDSTGADDDDEEVFFGGFQATIVGIRYYKGRVNNNEMVSITREFHNPYDCNAMRIDNIYGIQVGNIKIDQAIGIASVVDAGQARVEGTVPFGMNNRHTIPCDVYFYGKEKDRHNVTRVMAYYGYPISESLRDIRSGHCGSGSQRSGISSGILNKTQRIHSLAMKESLDKLFDNIGESNQTKIVEPTEAIKSPLLPYQKQALSWMMDRENINELPPFWEEVVPGKQYYNKVTNFRALKRPQAVHGGILADDPGMGKTLEMISLIVSNFKDGRPLITLKKRKATKRGREVILSTKASGINMKKKNSSVSTEATFQASDIEQPNEEVFHLPNLPLLPSVSEYDIIADPMVVATVDVDTSSPRVESSLLFDSFQPLLQAENPHNVQQNAQNSTKPRRYTRSVSKKAKYNFDDDNDGLLIEEAKIEPCTKDVKDVKASKVADAKVRSESYQENEESDSENRKNNKANCPRKTKKKNSLANIDYVPGILEKDEKDLPAAKFSCVKTEGTGPRATLIICPLSVLSNWQDQIVTHVYAGCLDLFTYHGSDRMRNADELGQKDIVLTTYQTLSHDFSKGNSPLLSTHWLRVVLDEGHAIRNPTSLQSRAAHQLKAERRWVVSGTPLQNSMKDLWSIICFLKLDPFTDRQWWRRTIERPVGQGEQEGLKRVQLLMKKIAMRRTKKQEVHGKPLLHLPELKVFLQEVNMSEEERDIYQAIAKQGRVTISKYVQAGTLLKNYSQILAILTRLRQICCHPSLCSDALEAAAEGLENSTPEELKKRLLAILKVILNAGVDEECPVCLHVLTCPVITHCAHVYCRSCIENVITTDPGISPRCPLCRRDIALGQLVEPAAEESETRPVKDGNWVSSSKVDALMKMLASQRQKDPTQKCLVVSQFTSFLDMLEVPLLAANFHFVRLDGSMSQKKRASAIHSFSETTHDSPTVILLSLKAGGEGINLTAANRVYLMEPAWNPAAEDQCFDRCHRLGQTKEVQIIKFVTKNSVEERVLELQEKKRKLIAGAFVKKQATDERRIQQVQDLQAVLQI